ncbi:MAG: transglycosylase SLT domain-containing protein [Deferrisomatales bacterium]|nr:transglycosylase SLT domain-containing protein [Deferrisomatales bacterium]
MEEDAATRSRAAALALWCLTGLTACLGPTTPLGAVDRSTEARPAEPPSAGPQPGDASEERPRILFDPSYQQVHGPYTWKVAVVDPSAPGRPDAERLRVFYNGLEVTESATFQFRVGYRSRGESDAEELLLEMPHLRLRPLEDHDILVQYTPAHGTPLSAVYPFPEVRDLGAEEGLATTAPFSVAEDLLDVVWEAGRHYGLNPVLLVALIAQESSFDPHALSKARALGLTQITHLAERDIAPAFPGWPRYPGIETLSRDSLRRLIPRVVNGENEWRLDPVKSVWGGAHYLSHLRGRLLHERNRPALSLGGEDEDRVLIEACLAAYNSGLNRTLHWLRHHRRDWLDQGEATEAKRYVRKILSFYGAFRAAGEASAAEET